MWLSLSKILEPLQLWFSDWLLSSLGLWSDVYVYVSVASYPKCDPVTLLFKRHRPEGKAPPSLQSQLLIDRYRLKFLCLLAWRA